MTPPHLPLDLSGRRRALVAADVHGEYGKLQAALDTLGFDPGQDSLVIVGDLVDRGPDSMAALDWLTPPSVHRALGNHDIMPRLALQRQIERHDYRDWGGGWVLDRGDEEMERIATILEDAPTVITVTTPGGRQVGIAHADCGRDWDEHVTEISHGEAGSRIWRTNLTLWSRHTIRDIQKRVRDGEEVHPGWARVTGVDHVFHGHTIVPEPLTVANRTWLDCGAYQGGPLTVVDMDEWIATHPDTD